MLGKIRRKEFLTYINVSTDGEAAYALLGNGVTEMSVTYNGESTSETYIHEATASVEISSYKTTAAVTAKAFAGDAVFAFIDNIRRKRLTGAASRTEIVNVYTYCDAGQEGVYQAERQTVSVQIDRYGGKGGEDLTIDFTLNFIGDATVGTFDAQTLTFAPTDAVGA